MKKFTYLFSVLAILTACNSVSDKQATTQDSVDLMVTQDEPAVSKGVIEFVESEYDFGTIEDGTVVEHTFKFKNTGVEPVILTQVTASCGCTTPDYTQTPVAPGKQGLINVSFNSTGQLGAQQKIITVLSNTEKPQTVSIKGTVIEKK